MIKVTAVAPGSIAAELGIEPGTELLSVDGRDLDDFLYWEFLSAEERFTLHFRRSDGGEIVADIERPLGVGFGLSLEPPRIRRCANRCDFCFVEGNPGGLRDALYIRDDDYRLSFRYGNFATLTNLKPRDVERIVAYRLSPLYVSVHATDPVTRRRVLRNPTAPAIIPQLRGLAEHGIRFHTQIVVQPEVNDGSVLRQTLADLWAFGPEVLSCSVVPVGLTEYSGRHKVREATAEECREAVALVESYWPRALAARGAHWACGADELYLRAGLELPPPEVYDDFEQVENGVGAVRWLQSRIAAAGDALARLDGSRIAIVTGTAMAPLMPQVAEPLARCTGAVFEILPVSNALFGASVTTAGLLPGAAIQAALRGRHDLDLAHIPGECVSDEELFMDGMTLDGLAASVPMEVRPSRDFSDALSLPVAA
jgi:putative radical SAM enzyme (TIGR03279 family)